MGPGRKRVLRVHTPRARRSTWQREGTREKQRNEAYSSARTLLPAASVSVVSAGGMPGPEVAKNSEAAVERLFPHPPWPVVPGYVARRTVLGALLVAVGLFTTAYYEFEVAREFTRAQRERVLWSEPQPPAEPLVEVPATVRLTDSNSKFVLYSTTLEVSFDVGGVSRTRTQLVRTLFSSLDPDVAARVRFHRERPEDWALNWAALAHGSRVQALLFLAFAGLLVGGGVAFFGFALWLGADRVRRVALRGVTIAAEVTEVEEQKAYGRRTGAFIHRFRMPASHGAKRREAVFSGKHPRPLLLDEGRRLVVCILPQDPNVFVVPREDLHPFDFEETVRLRIRERAKQGR